MDGADRGLSSGCAEPELDPDQPGDHRHDPRDHAEGTGAGHINPIWFYGPYDPFLVTIGAQPDWYMGWLEGALRLFPPWEFSGWGYMIANPFFPAVLLPGLTFLGLYSYPYLERILTGDRQEHHLLDRPRDRPVRTGFGVGVLTFYAMLTIAGSQDIIAFQLNVAITGLVWVLRITTVVLPFLTGAIAYRWARDLQGAGAPAGAAEHEELEGEDDDDPTGGGGGRSKVGIVLAVIAAYVLARWRRRPDLPRSLR